MRSPPSPPVAPPYKGRGAVSNPQGRFERLRFEHVDDGWWQEADGTPLATSVTDESCRRIISRNTSPDIPFEASINPYRGCEHGCIYCYARPTHGYLGLSSGLDFETKLVAKRNAPQQLEAELCRPGYQPRPIMLGANTDPYQPVERRLQITRDLLQVLADCCHPVAITTKSALVVRDLDLLAGMAASNLASVGISITTLDSRLTRRMEPRAASPEKRLSAIRALHAEGVPVTVIAAPMIPFVNDHELERILEAGAAAGAARASYTLLRLPLDLKDLFSQWLKTHLPERADRVLDRLRDCRDGQLYVADWSSRMRGTGEYATLLAQRFAVTCRRLRIERAASGALALDCSQFRPPARDRQLRLF